MGWKLKLLAWLLLGIAFVGAILLFIVTFPFIAIALVCGIPLGLLLWGMSWIIRALR